MGGNTWPTPATYIKGGLRYYLSDSVHLYKCVITRIPLTGITGEGCVVVVGIGGISIYALPLCRSLRHLICNLCSTRGDSQGNKQD